MTVASIRKMREAEAVNDIDDVMCSLRAVSHLLEHAALSSEQDNALPSPVELAALVHLHAERLYAILVALGARTELVDGTG